MGLWAAIKKAVNSDLSTPLNTQIDTIGTRLDTVVASRAPASTALSTANWTGARAGYLDNLNKSLFTAGSAIRSVQRGTGTITTTGSSGGSTSISLSAVTPSKCFVIIGHASANGLTPYITSLSSTSLNLAVGGVAGSSTSNTFSWQVIEFY